MNAIVQGLGQKGQAAKWRASEKLLQMLQEVKKEEEIDTSLTGTTIINLTELKNKILFLDQFKSSTSENGENSIRCFSTWDCWQCEKDNFY